MSDFFDVEQTIPDSIRSHYKVVSIVYSQDRPVVEDSYPLANNREIQDYIDYFNGLYDEGERIVHEIYLFTTKVVRVWSIQN